MEGKRVRMTQHEGDEEEVEYESGEEEGEDDDEDEDEDDEDEDDDEIDVDFAYSPAKAGIIEKISLKNFMCHDSFELELGPQLNFIIGRNGSGKSAILTGISVGLGAKATDTSRGSSIKSLIKDGKSTARVTIILKNEGTEAFNPEEYGKKIIVERKFQRQGNNAYYIKNGETGKTISTKKSVLEDMCYKFNITVDNPLAFLSQDKAREFLTATTDHIKYDYFMAGALINDILENYKLISKNIVEVQNKLNLVKTDLQVAVSKYEELKSLYTKFKKSDYLRRQLDLINGKMYWFNVRVIETKMNKYKEELNKNEEEIILIEEEIDIIDEKSLSKFDERKSKLLDEALEKHKLFEGKQNVNATLKDKLKEIKIGIDDINNEIENYSEEIATTKAEIKNLKRELKDEQEKIDELNGGSKEKLMENMQNLKNELEKLKTKKDEILEQLTKLQDNEGDSKAIRDGKEKVAASNELLGTLRDRRKNLLDLQRDKYTPWGGKDINNVLREIKHIGEDWHREPIGPIGSYVEVKNEFNQWKDILNASFGKTLDSFLVHDDHDRRMLEQILKRHRINKNIITRKYEKFNFHQGKAQILDDYKSDCVVIIDILTITNENVLYTLIDSNSIEKNVLANDRSMARQLLGNSHSGVLNVFLLLDHKSGHRSSGDSNSYRIDPIYYRLREPHKFSSGESSVDQIKELDEEINSESANNNDLVRELRRLKMVIQNEIQDLEKSREALDIQIRKVSNEIYRIENRLTENGDLAIVETLRDKIEENERQIRQRSGIIESLTEDRENEISKFKEQKKSLALDNAELEALENEVKEAKQSLSDLETEFHVKTNEKAHYEQQKSKKQENVSTLQDKLKRGEVALQQHTSEALTKCPREDVTVSSEDTVESITEEYKRAQEMVKESEKNIGRSYEEIQEELLSNKYKMEALESTENDFDSISRSLNEDLNQRLKYLHTTILKSIREASNSFERSLALRGFKGELKFGFKEKTLTMLVQTNNFDDNSTFGENKKRTVESLSGGEKSFTQIALLLAIWKAMNSKIRGLDEFDVFMDSVNRSISIKLLLTELRKYPKSQSIFITPQDIAIVGDLDSEDVKIHKMDDPRNS